MAYDHKVAVASGFVAYDTYLTGECGADGVADIDLDVQSLVLASPAGTEVRGEHAALRGHVEIAQVDAEGIGHGGGPVCEMVLPVLIEVGCWRFHLLILDEPDKCDGVDGLHLTVNGCLTCQQVLSHGRDCGQHHHGYRRNCLKFHLFFFGFLNRLFCKEAKTRSQN